MGAHQRSPKHRANTLPCTNMDGSGSGFPRFGFLSGSPSGLVQMLMLLRAYSRLPSLLILCISSYNSSSFTCYLYAEDSEVYSQARGVSYATVPGWTRFAHIVLPTYPLCTCSSTPSTEAGSPFTCTQAQHPGSSCLPLTDPIWFKAYQLDLVVKCMQTW